MIENQLENSTLDALLESVKKDFSRQLKNEVSARLARIDIMPLILEEVDRYIEKRMQEFGNRPFFNAKCIDWSDTQLDSKHIKFEYNGIENIADAVNLTVMDGEVVVENNLISKNLTVVEDANIKKLTVEKDLNVYGKVVFHSPDFLNNIKSYITNQIQEYKLNQDIDLLGKPLTSNQQMLLDKDSLGPSIAKSNLRRVGRLIELDVAGDTSLAETVNISNGRVGINTDEPSGALTVWDEESEFTVKKYKKRNTFIGTTRDCDLSIGVNSNPVLTVSKDGIATNRIKLENTTISVSQEEPSHVGSPGDIVINLNIDSKLPWAYRCVGGKTWVPLYSK